MRDTAEEYRQLVDARLFGLGPARYEQLFDLVLTLRKPQLAKDLNPVELSRTLQRGLRPIDEHLLVEAARSFDDMEAVARRLEGLVAADARHQPPSSRSTRPTCAPTPALPPTR